MLVSALSEKNTYINPASVLIESYPATICVSFSVFVSVS